VGAFGARLSPHDAAVDLIVVGAGISGSEAALACARGGMNVLLVTTSLDTVYNLVGEGAVLRPPPGTLLAECADAEPQAGERSVAAFSLHRRAKTALEHHPRLHLLQSSVSGLLTRAGRVTGVATWEGVDRHAPRVALCAGSFLRARLTLGALTETSGRLSEMAYDDLYDDLAARGFAFEPLTLEAPASRGAPAYTVSCARFGAAEWNARTFALGRLEGLYAAGVCASGYLSYEAAALQGVALAQALLAAPAGAAPTPRALQKPH
jgi:tRNA U34 5-carboxymethylaminomethyl modifying enzyme MnmG/GidA